MATLQPVTTQSIGQAQTSVSGIAVEPQLRDVSRVRAAEGIAHELAATHGSVIEAVTQQYLDRALTFARSGGDESEVSAKVSVELGRAIANEIAAVSSAVPSFDRWMPTFMMMGA